eukprot:9475635-Pyramimonas_sp.AAC.1
MSRGAEAGATMRTNVGAPPDAAALAAQSRGRETFRGARRQPRTQQFSTHLARGAKPLDRGGPRKSIAIARRRRLARCAGVVYIAL